MAVILFHFPSIYWRNRIQSPPPRQSKATATINSSVDRGCLSRGNPQWFLWSPQGRSETQRLSNRRGGKKEKAIGGPRAPDPTSPTMAVARHRSLVPALARSAVPGGVLTVRHVPIEPQRLRFRPGGAWSEPSSHHHPPNEGVLQAIEEGGVLLVRPCRSSAALLRQILHRLIGGNDPPGSSPEFPQHPFIRQPPPPQTQPGADNGGGPREISPQQVSYGVHVASDIFRPRSSRESRQTK